jgi:GDPmannose 4,6-dehydratase
VATYREAYCMFACTGILANHESPLRRKRFVTQKIIEGVRAIKAGRQSTIQLGNLDIWLDWGWAPNYARAMALMLQAEQPCPRQFAQEAFAAGGLDLADHLESVDALKRPADLAYSAMNPARIQQKLGWQTKRPIREIVEKMYADALI